MKKIILLLSIISLCLIGCSNKNKTIVYYISNNDLTWLDCDEYYTNISHENFQALNDRLKELGKNYQVEFRMYNEYDSIQASNIYMDNRSIIEKIKSNDSQADIVPFNRTYINELEVLDDYFNQENGLELKKYYSEDTLKAFQINNHLYAVHKIIYPLSMGVICVKKDFYEKNKDIIDQNLDKPLNILKYFTENYQASNSEILMTGGSEFSNWIVDDFMDIDDTPFYIRKKDNKVVNAYEEETIREVMKLYIKNACNGNFGNTLDSDDYDSIIERDAIALIISEGYNLEISKSSIDDNYYSFNYGKERYTNTIGYSINKNSDCKDEAFDLLKTLNSDEKCSSILQFGINPRRNNEGKIEDDAHLNSIGSWNHLGNNLIIESAQGEVDDKLDYFSQFENKSSVHDSQIYPVNFDLSNIYQQLGEYYQMFNQLTIRDIDVKHGFANAKYQEGIEPISEKQYMDAIDEYAKLLKEAGVDEVQAELQRQLDEYLKVK